LLGLILFVGVCFLDLLSFARRPHLIVIGGALLVRGLAAESFNTFDMEFACPIKSRISYANTMNVLEKHSSTHIFDLELII